MKSILDRLRFNYKDLPNQGFVRAYCYDIPVYIKDWENANDENNPPLVCGQNAFYDILFEIVSWICINVRGDEGWKFYIPVDPDTKKPL